MFSTTVTWLALSLSVLPAPVSSFTPGFAAAAASAPFCIATKNGLVSVFVTNPTVTGVSAPAAALDAPADDEAGASAELDDAAGAAADDAAVDDAAAAAELDDVLDEAVVSFFLLPQAAPSSARAIPTPTRAVRCVRRRFAIRAVMFLLRATVGWFRSDY